MRRIKAKIHKARKTLSVKVNALFAALLPVALYAQDQLPLLREFMTVEIYQSVGLFVVCLNIFLKIREQPDED